MNTGYFYGCGGRTRTYDLRVMSPTSFQLLYSAICMRSLSAWLVYHSQAGLSTKIFLAFRHIEAPGYPQATKHPNKKRRTKKERALPWPILSQILTKNWKCSIFKNTSKKNRVLRNHSSGCPYPAPAEMTQGIGYAGPFPFPDTKISALLKNFSCITCT